MSVKHLQAMLDSVGNLDSHSFIRGNRRVDEFVSIANMPQKFLERSPKLSHALNHVPGAVPLGLDVEQRFQSANIE